MHSHRFKVPITAKIRLCPTFSETQQALAAVESAGASGVCLHARFQQDRPNLAAIPEAVPALLGPLSIATIYNGDAFCHSDMDRMRKLSGATSVMVGRGALCNASIFRVGDGSAEEPSAVAARFVALGAPSALDNDLEDTQFVLSWMLRGTVARVYAPGQSLRCTAYGFTAFYAPTHSHAYTHLH